MNVMVLPGPSVYYCPIFAEARPTYSLEASA